MAKFNPNDSYPNDSFFSKTEYFASQARGEFTVTFPTSHFLSSATGILATGKGLLAGGLMAKQANLPSMQLNTYEPVSFMGPTRKHAYGLQFSDLTVEFYLMGNNAQEAYSLYYLMNRWMEGIAGPRETPPPPPPPAAPPPPPPDTIKNNELPVSDSTSYDVRYYNEYIADGAIKLYAPNSTTAIMHIKYSELFPIDISGLQYSWESTDTPITMSVTFAYHYSRPIPIS